MMIYTAIRIILSGVIKDIFLRLIYVGICGNDAASKHKGVTEMHAQTFIYIVRTKDSTFSRRIAARSEREAVSKVTRQHGVQDYVVYQF